MIEIAGLCLERDTILILSMIVIKTRIGIIWEEAITASLGLDQ